MRTYGTRTAGWTRGWIDAGKTLRRRFCICFLAILTRLPLQSPAPYTQLLRLPHLIRLGPSPDREDTYCFPPPHASRLPQVRMRQPCRDCHRSGIYLGENSELNLNPRLKIKPHRPQTPPHPPPSPRGARWRTSYPHPSPHFSSARPRSAPLATPLAPTLSRSTASTSARV